MYLLKTNRNEIYIIWHFSLMLKMPFLGLNLKAWQCWVHVLVINYNKTNKTELIYCYWEMWSQGSGFTGPSKWRMNSGWRHFSISQEILMLHHWEVTNRKFSLEHINKNNYQIAYIINKTVLLSHFNVFYMYMY